MGQPSAIKVSLRTRDKRQALHLARALGYLAEQLISKGARSGMTYEEIRTEVKQHFQGLLRKQKATIAEDGCQSALNFDPLSASNIDPPFGTVEVVPVVHRGDPRGFV